MLYDIEQQHEIEGVIFEREMLCICTSDPKAGDSASAII